MSWIIFDADNTLFSTREIAKVADIAAMKFFSTLTNVPPEQLYKEWKKIVDVVKHSKIPLKRSRRYSYKCLLERYGIKEEFIENGFSKFKAKLLEEIQLFPMVRVLLVALKKKYKLAIVSEDFREMGIEKLKKLGVRKYFDILIYCDDVGVMKPSPKYYELFLKKTGAKPSDVIVVGDSFEKDLEIPKKLGMKVILADGERIIALLRSYSMNHARI